MAKLTKNGGLDRRTKESKQIERNTSAIQGRITKITLVFFVIAVVLYLLGEVFPGFGEWLKDMDDAIMSDIK
jgi:hypothetical protein